MALFRPTAQEVEEVNALLQLLTSEDLGALYSNAPERLKSEIGVLPDSDEQEHARKKEPDMGTASEMTLSKFNEVTTTPQRTARVQGTPTTTHGSEDSGDEKMHSRLSHTTARRPSSARRTGSPAARRDSAFYDRMMTWKAGADYKLRQVPQTDELTGCTFKPQVNSGRSSTPRGSTHSGQRLYADAFSKEHQLRRRAQELEMERLKDCTFTPKTNRPTAWAASPRCRRSPNQSQRSALARPGGHAHAQSREQAECTFQPQINAPPRAMANQSQYLSTNAFVRLSKPRPPPALEASAPVTTYQDLLGGPPCTSSSPRARTKEGPRDWTAFLQREEELQIRKVAKREKLMAEERAMMQPTLITPMAKRMAQHKPREAFVERMEQDVQRRQRRQSLDASHAATADAGFTFRPHISAQAQGTRAKTLEELVYGDRAKKQAAHDRQAAEEQAKQMQECTFTPRLNTSGTSGVEGKLHLAIQNPELYALWLKTHEAQKEAQRKAATAAHAEKENAECTFHPNIHPLPQYMSGIADSMALIRPKRTLPDKCNHTFGYAPKGL